MKRRSGGTLGFGVALLVLAVSVSSCASPAFVGHLESVISVAFSPDGAILASGSLDTTIRLWDVATGVELRTLVGHTKAVNFVAFSSDGRRLITASHDGTARLWDVASGAAIRLVVHGYLDGPTDAALSPDDKLLAVLGTSQGEHKNTIKLWNVDSGQEVRALGNHADSVAFSADGALVASGVHEYSRQVGIVKLWSTATGNEVRTLTGHVGQVVALAFSHNGKLIASGSHDSTIRIWTVATGGAVRTLLGHTSSVSSVAFSQDDKLLASGSLDDTVRLWDVETGNQLCALTGHDDVNSVAFSPNGRLLASGSYDGTLKLWDVVREVSPLSPQEILPWDQFNHYAASLEEMCNLEVRTLDEQRKLTGMPWLDDALYVFATGTCRTMEDISRGIEDLTGTLLSGISCTFDLVETGEQIVLEGMKAAAAEALGRPLSSAEESAIDELYESTVGQMVAGAADMLESEANQRFSEFADRLNPKVVGEAAVGVLRSNIPNYIAAFKGALVGGKLGILPSLRAVGVSAFRDLAADLKGVNVYTIPLAIAFYLNDVTGAGKSASMVLLGRNKLDEAIVLARECQDRSVNDYSYADICRLYQGCQLLRDACDLFYQSYHVLTPQFGAIPEKASFWESVLYGIDRTFLNPLGEAVCSVARETLHTPAFDTLPIPTGWYLGYGVGCGIKTNH